MKKQMLRVTTTILVILFVTTLFGGTKEFDMSMQPILKEYVKIHDSLAKNRMLGVKNAAKNIEKLAKKVNSRSVSGEHAKHYKNVSLNLQKAAKKIYSAMNIKEARMAFKELSKPMAMWASMSRPEGVKVLYCPMAKASWLQKSDVVKNPYDSNMPTCGSVVGGDMKMGKTH